MNNRKHRQGTDCTKIGADNLAENTQNVAEFNCQICLASPKGLDFNEKNASLGVRSPWSVDEMSSEFFCPQEFFVKADRLSFCFAEMTTYLVVAETEQVNHNLLQL